jgi:hypothetical protein
VNLSFCSLGEASAGCIEERDITNQFGSFASFLCHCLQQDAREDNKMMNCYKKENFKQNEVVFKLKLD